MKPSLNPHLEQKNHSEQKTPLKGALPAPFKEAFAVPPPPRLLRTPVVLLPKRRLHLALPETGPRHSGHFAIPNRHNTAFKMCRRLGSQCILAVVASTVLVMSVALQVDGCFATCSIGRVPKKES